MTRIERFRNNVVLITVLLYLLFNWGFMQLRIPPVAGGGLPVGEIVLLLSLMTINYTGVLGRLSLTVAMVPLGIWWTFGVGRALFDFGVHGTWALRDAAHVLESLFLLVGFVFAGDQQEPRALLRLDAQVPGHLRALRPALSGPGRDLAAVADHHLGHRLQRADLRQHDQHPADHARGGVLPAAVPRQPAAAPTSSRC